MLIPIPTISCAFFQKLILKAVHYKLHDYKCLILIEKQLTLIPIAGPINRYFWLNKFISQLKLGDRFDNRVPGQ